MATIPGYGGGTSWRTSVRIARSSEPERLSSVAAIVRRGDRDRFQTALFAPAAHREALFALYAFNYEIARVRESVTEPALGQIRLEWWRETIAAAYDGAPPQRHPVAEALTEVVRAFAPVREHFDRLLDARAADLRDEPPASLAALEDYAEGTSSRLVYLALEVLGARDPAAAETGRHAGIAYALAGMLRALPSAARAGRGIIPAEIAARCGLDRDDWQARRGTPALRAAVAEIAAAAAAHLSAARALRAAVPRSALAALLPTVIASRALTRLASAGHDPFDPHLARADPWQSWRLALAALRHRF
jgi:NADH dehydrogenase [ubiquinone] 1 alpha subcomplex assembly factor 6